MCTSNDSAWSLTLADGSLRLSQTAAETLRKAIREMDLLIQNPHRPDGTDHLTRLLMHLRTLRRSMA
jgi:hypothetical protein